MKARGIQRGVPGLHIRPIMRARLTERSIVDGPGAVVGARVTKEMAVGPQGSQQRPRHTARSVIDSQFLSELEVQTGDRHDGPCQHMHNCTEHCPARANT